MRNFARIKIGGTIVLIELETVIAVERTGDLSRFTLIGGTSFEFIMDQDAHDKIIESVMDPDKPMPSLH